MIEQSISCAHCMFVPLLDIGLHSCYVVRDSHCMPNCLKGLRIKVFNCYSTSFNILLMRSLELIMRFHLAFFACV